MFLGIFIGNIWSKKNSEKNVSQLYIETNNKESRKAIAVNEFEGPLLEVNDQQFSYDNLNISSQKALMKLSLDYRHQVNEILSGFAVEYAISQIREPGKPIKSNELPDLVTFYNGIITDEDVRKVYEKNKDKFPPNANQNHIILQIRIQLIAAKISEITDIEASKLIKEDKIKYYFKNLSMPASWLSFENSPKLTDSESPLISLHLIMNYNCRNCEKLNAQIGELLQQYDSKKIQLTLIHFSESFLDKEYYLNKAAVCVYLENKNDFWKFNLELLKRNNEIVLLKMTDLDKSREIIEEIFKSNKDLKTSITKVLSCIKDEEETSVAKRHLVSITNSIKFISFSNEPVFIVNGVKVDLKEKTLLKAFKSVVIPQ